MSKFKHEVQDLHPVIESLIKKSGWEPIAEGLTHKYIRSFYEDMIFWSKFLTYFNKELILSDKKDLVTIDSDFFSSLRLQIINRISEKGFHQFLKQQMRVVLPDGSEFFFYPVDKDPKRNVYNYKRELSFYKDQDGRIDFGWIINGFIPFDNEVKLNVQGRKEAEVQYKTRPQNHPYFKLNHRSIAHFANDESSVSFSTSASPNSKFLPFNKDVVNPKAEPFDSAYLYSEFMTPENAVKIIHEFCFYQRTANGKEILVFPRFHQFRDVIDLSSHHYLDKEKNNFDNSPVLAQHSPGAGKTYKEIWDGYQSIVHNKYQKAILGANSKKLVKQLFDEATAFMESFAPEDRLPVVYADKPLKDVLKEYSGRVIICTTLQKFNQTSQSELSNYQDQLFFISIDEETGTGGSNQSIATDLGNLQEAIGEEDTDKFHETYKKMRAAKNLKFSCNTGTPSKDTLDLFGYTDNDGNKKAHYYYSMEQSLKEGFTVYPLQNFIRVAPEYVAKAIDPDKQVHQLIVDAEVKRQIAIQLQKPEMREDRLQEIIKNLKIIKKKGHLHAILHAVSTVEEAKEVTRWLQVNSPSWIKVCVDFNVTTETKEDLEELNQSLLEKYKDEVDINSIGDFFKKKSEYNYMVVVNKNLIGYSNDRLNIIVLDRVLSTDEVIVQVISRLNRTDSWDKQTYVIDTCNQQIRIEKAMGKYYSKQSTLKTALKRMQEIQELFTISLKANSTFSTYMKNGGSLSDLKLKAMALEFVNSDSQNSAIRLLSQYRELYEEISKKDETVTDIQTNFYKLAESLIEELIPHKKDFSKNEDVSKDLEVKVLGYTSETKEFEISESKEKPIKLDNPQDPEYKDLKEALEKHNVLEEFSDEDTIKMLPLYKELKKKGLDRDQMDSTMVLLINCTKGSARKTIIANKDPVKMEAQIKRQVFVHTLGNKGLKSRIYDDTGVLSDIVETVSQLAVNPLIT